MLLHDETRDDARPGERASATGAPLPLGNHVEAAPIAPLEAVVLAAGAGTRIRVDDDAPPKPLTRVLGRTLIERSVRSFARAGVQRLTVVVGFKGETIATAVEELAPRYGLDVCTAENRRWEAGNGTSVLAAAASVSGPFYLAMGDHLFDPAVLDELATGDEGATLSLAADHNWTQVPDVDEATKVLLDGRYIVEIGKELPEFDAIDTGVFLCREGIFDSLSGAVRVLARRDEAMTTPVSGLFWQDVDTPADLALAELRLRWQSAVAAPGEITSGLRVLQPEPRSLIE